LHPVACVIVSTTRSMQFGVMLRWLLSICEVWTSGTLRLP
jgi:hypothetical protein